MKKLFDVSHANSYSLIKIPEDYQFLQDQQNVRKMIMVGEDRVQNKRRKKKQQKRKHIELQRQVRAKQRKEISITSP